MIVEFLEAAQSDLKRSKEYYSDIETELGGYFLKDIEGALKDIKEHPKASSKHTTFPHLRLKPCRRFPFTIIYHPDFKTNRVYIVAVAHQIRESRITGLIVLTGNKTGQTVSPSKVSDQVLQVWL